MSVFPTDPSALSCTVTITIPESSGVSGRRNFGPSMKETSDQSGCACKSLIRSKVETGEPSSLRFGTATNFRVVVGGRLRMVTGVSDMAVRTDVSASLVSSLMGFRHRMMRFSRRDHLASTRGLSVKRREMFLVRALLRSVTMAAVRLLPEAAKRCSDAWLRGILMWTSDGGVPLDVGPLTMDLLVSRMFQVELAHRTERSVWALTDLAMSAKEVSVICSKPGTLKGDLLAGWGPSRLFLDFGGGPAVWEV